MNKRLVSALLLSSALTMPMAAWAQDSTTTDTTAPTATGTPPIAEPEGAEEADAPDVSIPGGEILVTGQRSRNVQRYAPQVVSVLSTEQIARTGEGDIAGALSRVTGLSVVGNGYVYVRGLGDRYSLALLNGSPLPSPEPLKRVVPLDLFPTSMIASSLVQKSYSVNFPGEFGGGVINLTTRAVPDKPFLTVGGGASWDTETTNKLGYTYYGSKTDWTGYDNGNRNLSVEMKDYLKSGTLLNGTSDEARAIGSTLINGRNGVIQRDDHQPVNFSGSISGGTFVDIGEVRLGVIAAGSYSNTLQTKDITTQRVAGLDPDTREQDFQQIVTDNRIVANAMVGLGLEWGENKIRWTNLYIHDTVKRTALALGYQNATPSIDYMNQDTGFYERQLLDTQIVGEFKLGGDTELDVRGGYANSKRKAPYEISLQYVRSNSGQFGDSFINRLDGGNQGDAEVTFSNLNEDVWSAGADLSHSFSPGWTGTVGYAYQLNDRRTSRRAFQIRAQGDTRLVSAFGLLRPDVLFQPGMFFIDQATGGAVDYHLLTNEIDFAGAVFDAKLNNHAWYAKLNGSLTEALTFDLGVRWEFANQFAGVVPIADTGTAIPDANLEREYWLPALTLTYEIQPGLQARVNASKTIARPQFRELLYQTFFDPDSNRSYRGNPLLVDSQLYNAEARVEWYMNRGDKVSLGAFFKRLDNPIETFLVRPGNDFVTTYANAPKADLYGAEIEAQKYFDAFADRRILISANYTYTKSKLKVKEGDTTEVYGASTNNALDYFRNGAPLTGQSEHIANVQIGLEQQGKLSQQTLLLNYASKRATSRGLNQSGQPDIFENPGFTLDFVVRQGIALAGKDVELKFEARNITGRRHLEYQDFEAGRIQVNSYDVGRVFALSAAVTF
ncbi:TonB-dependent receptor domain-containing protein [Novosphingobium sp. P6W]|uniref:TonB-dependent receptor domain-containing protein n=1 Tax=Novosphingobium sp. P6W TaxID=1609758 RepID=UPI0005C2D475|nr:TonB-dependent receptor [Novosphingobium sp. P6W]AXB77477.1 TonB-dependent receptor [Novosphingobium sp. P6W]KIS33844.1 TonB-dependent receptor [Novosphingobium sp. P6W]